MPSTVPEAEFIKTLEAAFANAWFQSFGDTVNGRRASRALAKAVSAHVLSTLASLDDIPDGDGAGGGLYAKPKRTALTAGEVDLSLAGVINKTLANIADDVASTRYAVSAIDAARKAIVDLSQAHTGTLPKAKVAAAGTWSAAEVPEAGSVTGQGALATKNTVAAVDIDANAVTAPKILDGAITNAKVDAAAGIVGTKLSGGAGVLKALETGTGRLVDPELKDGTGVVHRKLKNVGGKFKTTDASDVEVATEFGGAVTVEGAATFQAPAKFEQKLSVLAAESDGVPAALVFDRAGRNVVKNPSFEVDTSDWTPANGTVTRTNADFLWGAWCGLLNGTSAVNQVEITSNSDAALDAETWTASAYIRGVTGTVECSLKIEFLDANDVVLDTTTSDSAISVDAVTSEWRRIVLNATASDALTAKVRMSVIGGLSTDTDVYVDACQLEKTSSLASHASSYLDGSLGEGYAWEGTAHASASTRTGGWSHLGGLDGTIAKYLMVTDEGTLTARSLAAGSDVVWVEVGNKATGFTEGEVRAKGMAADVHLNLVPQGSNGRVRLGPSGTALSIAGAGTSFPTSPGTNDRFFRTDRGIDYYYDGTRWLSVDLHHATFSLSAAVMPFSASLTSHRLTQIDDRGSGNIFVHEWRNSSFVTTTNTGAAFWEAELYRSDGAANTLVNSFSTGSTPDTASRWVTHHETIDAVVSAAAAIQWAIAVVKNGSPGTLFLTTALSYRLIG